MPGSRFAAEFAAAFGEVEDVHGEEFLLTPMRRALDVNAPAIADITRAQTTLIGVWHDSAASPAIPNAYDPRTNQRPGVVTDKPRVDFGPGRIPAGLALRLGDLLTRLADGSRWRLSAPVMSRQGITRCDVNAAG
jgi:hypothetical protein